MSKTFAVILVIICLFSVSLAEIDLSFENSNYKNYTFVQFKKDFNKKYQNQNEAFRRGIFEKNLERVKEHNDDTEQTYQQGINQFSDLTQEEFKQTYLNYKPSEAFVQTSVINPEKIETSVAVDWVRAGKVTSIKMQQPCGACYAFSAAAAIESAYLIHYGIYYDISEQHIIDCSAILGNSKCNGGNANIAFEYIKQYGVMTEDEKPFLEMNGTCDQKKGKVKIHDYVFTKGCDELERGLTLNPVAVEVATDNWSAYKSGIFPSCSGPINHAVLAVGMTRQYWKIKNTWNSSWGEAGFMRLARGNTCEICTFLTYPILK